MSLVANFIVLFLLILLLNTEYSVNTLGTSVMTATTDLTQLSFKHMKVNGMLVENRQNVRTLVAGWTLLRDKPVLKIVL